MDDNRLNLDTGSLLLALAQRWKLLLAAMLLATVVAAVVVWREPIRYEATATLVPSTNVQVSKDLFNNDMHHDSWLFGHKREVDHLLEIMSSQSLAMLVADRLNLWEQWGIEQSAHGQMFAAYQGHVSVRATQYQGVQIVARHVQPEQAALLANAVAACADTLVRSLRQQLGKQAFAALERHQRAEQLRLDALADSIRQANAARQSERAMRYSHELQHGAQNMVHLSNQLGAMRVEAEQPVSWFYVLDYAHVPDSPAAQRGWRFVVVCALGALLVAACALLAWEWLAQVLCNAKQRN